MSSRIRATSSGPALAKISVTLAFALMPAIALSQAIDITPSIQKRAQNKPTPPAQQLPCSTTTKFEPIDPYSISAGFKKADLTKREMETTAEHKARIEPTLKELNQTFAKSGRSELIVAIPATSDHISYNADTATMTASSLTGLVDRDASTGAMTVQTWEMDAGTYEGVSGFGVKTTVTNRKATILKITAPKLTLEAMIRKRSIQFPIPRNEAAETKDKIAYLLVARLKPPYFSLAKRRLSPKLNFPYDYDFTEETIHAEIVCAAIFNRTTGKIVRPIAINQL